MVAVVGVSVVFRDPDPDIDRANAEAFTNMPLPAQAPFDVCLESVVSLRTLL